MILQPGQVLGDMIELQRTHSKHFFGQTGETTSARANNSKDFGVVLLDAVNKASDLQLESTGLQQSIITDPDSVDVHDVTIAMAEANMAVQLTKAVVDAAIKAYNEIINIR